MKLLEFIILSSSIKLIYSRYSYETMFITGDDKIYIWVDGDFMRGLKFLDYWSYPDRIEIRSDVKLIAARVDQRNINAYTPHGLMSWSKSGRYSTDSGLWRCRDHVDDSEINDWFKLNFISSTDWPSAIKLGWNDNFEDKTNPWNGPVRIIPSTAIWIGCKLSFSRSCYCLLNLGDNQVAESHHKTTRLLNLGLEFFNSHPPIVLSSISNEKIISQLKNSYLKEILSPTTLE